MIDRLPIDIRAITGSDLHAAAKLSADSGWPHRHEDWALMLRAGFGLVATDRAGNLVGTAMGWGYGPDAAAVGMIIVAKQAQGRGLGRKLTTAMLDLLDRPRILLHATQDGLPLYRSLGFREVGVVRQYQGLAKAQGRSAGVRPATELDRWVSARLDGESFGAPRTNLLSLLAASGHGFVREGPDGLADGFSIRRPFGRGHLIGPLAARDEAATLALIAGTLDEGFMRIDVFEPTPGLDAALTQAGLRHVGGAVRMVRGAWPVPAPPGCGIALASQAYG